MDVKLDVFRTIDRYAPPGAVLASNTSSLDLDMLAAATQRPSDVVGMHFFSPAHVMRLVEVVEGAETSASTLATALAVTRRLRKLAVVAQVGPGFIGNRVFDAYLRQANLLVREGLRPADIDAALEAWGMAMGPFRVLDLVGNDVPFRARQGRPADPAWDVADTLVAYGWLGRKTGIGWYDYTTDTPTPNEQLLKLLPPAATGIDPDEIVARCILAMVNEAAGVIADGIASTPADVDTALVNGYGFPARRGGPWFWAELTGFDAATARMRRWSRETGDPSWTPHPRLTSASEEAAA
jgi:3-hydroxyacyl-CoA dehydrogenase